MAFVWELTKETIDLPLGCLQGGYDLIPASIPEEYDSCPGNWSR
jgi:hypothetical protein